MNWSSLLLSAALVGATCQPLPVQAQASSEVIYQRKAWAVYLTSYDDGSIYCIAQVNHPGEVFALWADPREEVRIQFYSDGWNFDGGSADLEVQIDRRAPWDLTNAEMVAQSVWFTLPDSDSSIRFLNEVMRGNSLILRNDRGQHVQTYPLAGSSASIGALIDCVDVLQRRPNPFN